MSSPETSTRSDLIEDTLLSIGAKSPEDLTRVSEAMLTTTHAGALLDQVVREAHEAGRSWGAIGVMLGMSRQAARQRWGV